MGCCASAHPHSEEPSKRRRSSALPPQSAHPSQQCGPIAYAVSESIKGDQDLELDPDLLLDPDLYADLEEPGVASPTMVVEGTRSPMSRETRDRVALWLSATPQRDMEEVPEPVLHDDTPLVTFHAPSTLTTITTVSGNGMITFIEPLADRAYQDDAFPTPLHRGPSLSLSLSSKHNTPRSRKNADGDTCESPQAAAKSLATASAAADVPQLSVEHYGLEADCDGNGPSQQSPSAAAVMLHPGFGLNRRTSRNTMTSISVNDVPSRDSDLLLDYFDAIPISRRRSEGTTVSSTFVHEQNTTPLPGQIIWSLMEESTSATPRPDDGCC